jgi:hypothetical protein
VEKRRIQELASLRFVSSGSNVLFLGPPGVGKPQPAYYPSRSQCCTGPHHFCC